MERDLERSLDLLKENEQHVRNNAESALFTICQNILLHPNEKQYREVRLDEPLVTTNLLPALGAIECLFDIGFVEATDCLTLPDDAPLAKLQNLQGLLRKHCPSTTPVVKNLVPYSLLSSASNKQEMSFFQLIVRQYQFVLQYEDKDLQEKAKRLIPIVDLEIATMTRIRQLQRHFKLNETNPEKGEGKQCTDVDDTKDLFLMELLHWFKYKFFTWIDSPKCTACFSKCKLHGRVWSDDPRCVQVEIHKCTKCGTCVKFPRYADAEPLLTLRRGRCGEWATVFTLFCRTLGYDARLVLDRTDHVWTEVWSIYEKRWIHLDPCEGVMDRPLMYEKGWKKKLTYIIAFSKDEVQDVTWRYTRDQLEVMKRRNRCPELKLMNFLKSLNNYHQTSPNFSPSRRQYVIKRRLLELVELIYVPNSQNSDENENYEGRQSGSYAWKLARGEISEVNSTANYSWDISKYGDAFLLQYSIVKDRYTVTNSDGKTVMDLSGWQNGVNEAQGGMFRKEEADWNMAYLARSPGSTSGKVKWCFTVTDPNLCVKSFNLEATVKIFHEAQVSWVLEGFLDNKNEKLLVLSINDCSNYYTEQLKGSVKLILTASVSGGQGDCAWQHAQLFRQSLETEEDRSLSINILLETRKE